MALAGKKKKIFDGRYEILSIVGRGAASVVYHARHVDTPMREVALKVLIQSKDETKTSDKLRKEALAMVSSRHKYVVRLDDFHSVGDLCYLSMEFAAESDLRKYAQKFGGKLSPVQGELYLLQMAEALSFMHNAGIIHRDIKPDNILVASPKEIRLADFGVTVLPGEESSLADLQAGVGTMDYMAPEVLQGLRYDAASDIYSLGVTFYELLSGQHPFANIPLAQQLEVRREGKFPPLYKAAPNVPIYLSNLVMQAMQFDPARRLKSAKEISQAILMSKAAVTIPETTPGTPQANPALTAKSASTSTSSTTGADARRAAARAILSGTPNRSAAPISPAAGTPLGATTSAAPQKSNAAAIMATWAAMGLSKPTPGEAPKVELAKPTVSQEPAITPPTPTATSVATPKVAEPKPAEQAVIAPALLATNATTAALTPSAQKDADTNIPGMIKVTPPIAPQVNLTPKKPSQSQTTPTELASPAVTDTVILKPADIQAAIKPAAKAGSLAASALLQSSTAADILSESAPVQEVPESKKTTQIITKDLVQRVRADFAAEETKGATQEEDEFGEPFTKAHPAQPAKQTSQQASNAAPISSKKPAIEGRKPLQRKGEKGAGNSRKAQKSSNKGDLPLPIKARQFAAALMVAFRQRDRKKSFFLAMSIFVFLVILYYGNIFLIRRYNIGIAKSYLAEQPQKPSPLPRYTGEELRFPAVPAGVFAGKITGIIPGETSPLTFISLGEQKKLVVLLGIPGWKPAVLSIDAEWLAANPGAPLRLASSGLVLDIAGRAVGGELTGEFTDVISGAKGEWHVRPAQQ
ncbi:MAG: protein kinase [Oligoflexia bacterium]|nr:protein kinase [Oligoflexia bacterium]